MTEQEINQRLIEYSKGPLSDNDFISAAVKLNDAGSAYHAGLIFKVKGKTYLCHFIAGMPDIVEGLPSGWYYLKNYDKFNPELAEAALTLCRILESTVIIGRNRMYNGGWFTEEGIYRSNAEDHMQMTCVGFCLCVLKGLLFPKGEGELIQYEDWDAADMDDYQTWLELYLELPENQGKTEDSFEPLFRRIDEIDYLATAYLTEIPFTKDSILQFKATLTQVLRNRRLPNPEQVDMFNDSNGT